MQRTLLWGGLKATESFLQGLRCFTQGLQVGRLIDLEIREAMKHI